MLAMIVTGVVLLQPKTVAVKLERATRQTPEVPYRLSDWNVDVAKLPIPGKELFSSIQRVTLPTTSPELALNGSLPKLSLVPKAALGRIHGPVSEQQFEQLAVLAGVRARNGEPTGDLPGCTGVLEQGC